jgi:recombination protein RecR
LQIIPKSIQSLIDEFSKLPGIGPKTAQRLTFYLLRKPDKSTTDLGTAALGLKKDIAFCSVCCNFTDNTICSICSDTSRDQTKICVVSEPLDVVALERSGSFKGLYHVLGGVISPVDGIGPDELFIAQLVTRLKEGIAKELVIATNPTLEGETTALYVQKVATPYNIMITRIARGLPVGGDLEYADEITLSRALEGRREY